MKIIAFILGLLVAFYATTADAAADDISGPVSLRDSAVVSGDLVRLGDIFVNAGQNAEKAVAYSPEPGKRAIFDANWLYRIANHFGLRWRPQGNRERIVVMRDSQTISAAEIGNHILAALLQKGADPEMQVDLDNRLLRLFVDGAANATVGVESATFDTRSRRFSAYITAPADDPTAQRIRVTGRLYQMKDVPVLIRPIRSNEIIRKRDIKLVKLRSDQIQRGSIELAENLVGMAPRRGLRAGTPVRVSEIRRPLLVEKNSLVTIYLKTPLMSLSAKGKALESGGQGDTVRIRNNQSKHVIDAVVTGASTVTVYSFGRVALN
jgi:flagella basal body P-ring formation protein FlgA